MPRKQPKSARSLYRVHSGVLMLIKWERELKEKTGRSLEEWSRFLNKQCKGLDRAARIVFLKDEHGIGSNSAWWLADRSLGELHPWDSTEEGYLAKCPELVDAQFAGAKSHLRTIGDALLDLCRACGPDVGISPCETIIPAYRTHVFAQVSVPNRKVVRLSLALKGERFTKRLVDTGGTAKKDRLSHRVDIALPAEIDGAVEAALRRAYEADAR
jgi:Domain of unknown function (DUF5655)